MSWTAAVQGASVTPATDLYTTVTGLMTSWSLVDTVTAANAGTVADCKVWEAPGADWYIIFEIDDGNARLRFRVSYQYTAGTDKVKRYIPTLASSTASAPKADYSFDDTDKTIVTAGWITVGTSSGGFNYWVGVGAGNGSAQDLIFVGTNSGKPASYFLGGLFTPTDAGDTHPIFMTSDASPSAPYDANQWTGIDSGTIGVCRVAFEWGSLTSAAGNFCYALAAMRLAGCTAGAFGNFYGTSRNQYTSDGLFAFDCFIHGIQNAAGFGRPNGAGANLIFTAERGTLPDFKCGGIAAGSLSVLGDTVVINGDTYTILGNCISYGNTPNSSSQTLMVKTSTAFA